MENSIHLRDLSPASQRLVLLMRQLGYGRIEGLLFRGGEPLFSPPPRVIRKKKLGASSALDPIAPSHDFTLKEAVIDLIAEMKRIGSGVIDVIEVQGGLPFLLTMEEARPA